MTIEEDIETVLITRMEALTLTPALPVEWPNRHFDPPNDGSAYLSVRHIRNDNSRLFVKGNNPHLRLGILQVDVMTPKDAGYLDGTAIAGQIAAHFPADLRLYGESVRVDIEMAPTVNGSIPLDAWWQTPVSIRYLCLS